ncbi:MAG: hypothetical protein K6E29_02585 [Cyanobacteria bacterium RUI128]|nr:hypothetical protein [Cyanobacteria bacterium RUI128]
MDAKELLNNKNFLIGALAVGVVVFALLITMAVVTSVNASKGGGQVVKEKVIKGPLDLLTTDNLGKAIEIQALLAREGITVERKVDGTKSTLFLPKYTQSQRDRALLAIVKSGLMDQNVGLEMFDKGDFTSTKEDKKIRLVRAIDGELARLIRKIPPIENASVFVSIPEQTMFSSNQKPVTATVQIDMPSGEKLDAFKVKAITNLLIGSVSGLTSENVAITDTNGNVYNSIMSPSDEQEERMRENDKYMQQKVNIQLDRLVGKGNYTATVSTFLKQSPTEKFTTWYDPNTKTAMSEQTFQEGLGDQTADSNRNTNAVSVYLPNGLPGGGADSSQNRNYSRTAREVQYGVSQIQTKEFANSGTIEDISIAVTLDKAALPPDISIEELKELIAHAASPKAKAENVSIAFNDSNDPYLASDNPEKLPKPEETGNPWWLAVALVGLSLIIGHRFVVKRLAKMREQHEGEMDLLREKSMQQERQLQDVSRRAADLLSQQDAMRQDLLLEMDARGVGQRNIDLAELKDALEELREEFEMFDEEEGAVQMKSWIEQ